jgi:hypothetical protein
METHPFETNLVITHSEAIKMTLKSLEIDSPGPD